MARNKGHSLYFVCVLMPDDIGMEVTALKHEIADKFNASYALRTPPHITLIPPFELPDDEVEQVAQMQDEALWGHAHFDVELNGFGNFGNRVIYLNVMPNDRLKSIYLEVVKAYKNMGKNIDASKPFNPHATIANRDLTAAKFERAWPHFAQRTFNRVFTVDEVHLLKHIDGRWQLFHKSPLP
jgi:2'-5' RNA ligase